MEELSLDNILDTEEIDNLFVEDDDKQETPPDKGDNPDKGENKEENKETTEVIDVDSLFTDKPESVGSEDNKEDNQEEEDTLSDKDKGTSPNTNFYSSIASALKDEGILSDLDDDSLKNIKSPEDFAEAMEKTIQAKFDERQKRIDEALNVGIEPSEIKKYENTLAYLNSLQDNDIKDESDKGEKLRKQVIYQDYINKGFSEARAKREMEKSFTAGTDIEDAKEAIESNKQHFQSEYERLIEEAKADEAEELKERKETAEKLKKSIFEDKEVLDGIQLDKTTRQKVYDNISKPVWKDEEGTYYTAIQKYELDNKVDFMKKIGVIFTLTDGFKNLDGLIKTKVKKETKNRLAELEHTLNNTSRNSDGTLKFVTGVDDTETSFKGWDLDV